MIYEAGKHSFLLRCTAYATDYLPVILVLMIIPAIASCKTHKLFSFPLGHEPPFQIGEEGMLVCITSYIARVRYVISLKEMYLNCLQHRNNNVYLPFW